MAQAQCKARVHPSRLTHTQQDSGGADVRVRVFRAGVFMALFGLPPLVPVNELGQVGRFLRIAYYKLVLQ